MLAFFPTWAHNEDVNETYDSITHDQFGNELNPAQRLNRYRGDDAWDDIIWQLDLDQQWLDDTGDEPGDDIFLADGTCIRYAPADEGQPWQKDGPHAMDDCTWAAQKEWDER